MSAENILTGQDLLRSTKGRFATVQSSAASPRGPARGGAGVTTLVKRSREFRPWR